uniref:Uncharacterized protein n=1 Tax=candidate division CPR3 bacterium TaxID=2268181 RepID=A0A7C5YS52_UNCC3
MKRDERILRIMQLMAEYNYTDWDTVCFLLFHYYGLTKASANVVATRYLSYLQSHHFTDVFHTDFLHKRKLHYLTGTGYKVLRAMGGRASARRFVPSRFFPMHLDHTLTVEKVGIIMAKSKYVVDFAPEKVARFLKRDKRIQGKVCDAEMVVKNKKGRSFTVGLEVQISNKQKETLVGYFQNFAKREDLHQVWWICSSENIIRRVVSAAEDHYVPIPHALTTLKEFLNKGLEESQWIDLKESRKFKVLEDLK